MFEYTNVFPIRFNGGPTSDVYVNEHKHLFTVYLKDQVRVKSEWKDQYVQLLPHTTYQGDIIMPHEEYIGRVEVEHDRPGPGAIIFHIGDPNIYVMINNESCYIFESPEEIIAMNYHIGDNETYYPWAYTKNYVLDLNGDDIDPTFFAYKTHDVAAHFLYSNGEAFNKISPIPYNRITTRDVKSKSKRALKNKNNFTKAASKHKSSSNR